MVFPAGACQKATYVNKLQVVSTVRIVVVGSLYLFFYMMYGILSFHSSILVICSVGLSNSFGVFKTFPI